MKKETQPDAELDFRKLAGCTDFLFFSEKVGLQKNPYLHDEKCIMHNASFFKTFLNRFMVANYNMHLIYI